MVADLLAGGGGQVLHGLGHGHRVEDVILEPGAQGDVPALPELGDGFGEEGTGEILRHGNAEDLGSTHHCVHGAGKVHIQLHRVAHGCNGDHAPLEILVAGKYRFDQRVEPIRHHHFFHHAKEDPLDAQGQVGEGDALHVPQLLCGLPVPADGALHDLGEKGHEQSQPEQILV